MLNGIKIFMEFDRITARLLSLFVYTSEKTPKGSSKDGQPEGKRLREERRTDTATSKKYGKSRYLI